MTPVHLQVSGHVDNVVEPLQVGGEAGAVDLHIAVGQDIEELIHRLTLILHQVPRVARADAGFLPNDHSARGFDDVGELPVGNGHGAAGEHETRRFFGHDPFRGLHTLLDFIAEFRRCFR